jgi:hypothetical protein
MTSDSRAPRNANELFEGPDAEKADGTEQFLDKPHNTADPRSLKRKQLSDKQKELSEENDLRAVLSTPEGVRLIARIIGGPCGWNLPHFHTSNSIMCEIAGRRSIGYQLENWISDVDLQLWFAVRQELEKQRPKPKTSQHPSRRQTG